MKVKKAKRSDAAVWRATAKKRAGKTVDMPPQLVEAVRRAEMDPRHDHLDPLMGDNPEPTQALIDLLRFHASVTGMKVKRGIQIGLAYKQFVRLLNDPHAKPVPMRQRKLKSGMPIHLTTEEVLAIRRDLGLTIEQFAKALNVKPKTVRHYEESAEVISGAAARLMMILRELMWLCWLGHKDVAVAIMKGVGIDPHELWPRRALHLSELSNAELAAIAKAEIPKEHRYDIDDVTPKGRRKAPRIKNAPKRG